MRCRSTCACDYRTRVFWAMYCWVMPWSWQKVGIFGTAQAPWREAGFRVILAPQNKGLANGQPSGFLWAEQVRSSESTTCYSLASYLSLRQISRRVKLFDTKTHLCRVSFGSSQSTVKPALPGRTSAVAKLFTPFLKSSWRWAGCRLACLQFASVAVRNIQRAKGDLSMFIYSHVGRHKFREMGAF